MAEDELPTYPGARSPARSYGLDVQGVRLQVHEWGQRTAPPLLLVHGGFDFARTFDVFAPLLADGGWRVVTWDHRGHGDSEHTALYSWDAEQRDLLGVADACAPGPCPVVGHSKGGSLLTQLILARPDRFTRLVAIDGMPARRSESAVERLSEYLTPEELASWLDHRRNLEGIARRAGTAVELAQRRARMNPRLSPDWLLYLVKVGARRDPDGWRWKIDPSLRMGGFGPWRWHSFSERLRGLPLPVLALLGSEPEPMDWGCQPDALRASLPPSAQVEVIKGAGHFIHIEQPLQTAELVLDFLAR